MPFDIEIQGLNDLLAHFNGVEEAMIDFRQLGAWKGVRSEFYKVVKEAFASEGGSTKGGKWKPLSSPYKERKLKRWGNVGILTASGKMYRSLTQEGAENSVYEETAQELTIGTTDPKARYHQGGTGRMPKREILSFTPAQEKQLMQPIQDKLVQLIGNAKLRSLRGF